MENNKLHCSLSQLRKIAIYRDFYSFFGNIFEISTDSKEIMEEFDYIYKKFKTNSYDVNKLYSVFLIKEYQDKSLLYINNKVFYIEQDSNWLDIYMFIFNFLIENVVDYFIIHGACLYNPEFNKGIVIAASSGLGKSTLSLHLLLENYYFLSDEIALLSITDGYLHSFPRAISIHKDMLPNTIFSMHKRSNKFITKSKLQKKIMIDIDDIIPGRARKTCSLDLVFFIESPPDNKINDNYSYMELTCFSITDQFIDQLKLIDGVISVDILQKIPEAILRIQYRSTKQLTALIESICIKHGIAIKSFYPEAKTRLNFDSMVTCTSLSPSQGMLRLLRYVLNTKALLKNLRSIEKPKEHQLLWTLGKRIKKTKFYIITPGKLNDMVGCINYKVREKNEQ